MNVADVFSPDIFNLTSLTGSFNTVPFLPGRLGELGIFDEAGVNTTSITIEWKDGTLALIPTSQRGAAGATRGQDKAKAIQIIAPHIQRNDLLMADSFQNVRAFGSGDQLVGQRQKLDEVLNMHAQDFDFTLEYHRLGAIQGIVLDADGTSEILNCFTAFGVAEPTEIDFDLDNASPASGAVKKKCQQVIRNMTAANLGLKPPRVHAFCGDGFFDDLISHPETVKLYEIQQNASEMVADSTYSQFTYGGITFENYQGSGSVAINTDKCRFVPVGVPGLFITRFAPADYMDTVNTIGLPRYAKPELAPHGKGMDIDMQSNPINLCRRPGMLQRAKRT